MTDHWHSSARPRCGPQRLANHTQTALLKHLARPLIVKDASLGFALFGRNGCVTGDPRRAPAPHGAYAARKVRAVRVADLAELATAAGGHPVFPIRETPLSLS